MVKIDAFESILESALQFSSFSTLHFHVPILLHRTRRSYLEFKSLLQIIFFLPIPFPEEVKEPEEKRERRILYLK